MAVNMSNTVKSLGVDARRHVHEDVKKTVVTIKSTNENGVVVALSTYELGSMLVRGMFAGIGMIQQEIDDNTKKKGK